MNLVIVYHKDVCPACDLVINFLENSQVKYELRNIDQVEQYRDEVIEMGFMGVPVVKPLVGDPFSGYDPVKLDGLVNN